MTAWAGRRAWLAVRKVLGAGFTSATSEVAVLTDPIWPIGGPPSELAQ